MLAFLINLLVYGNSLASTIFVSKEATGSNTGASWADAYTNLQTALLDTQSGSQIWVAAGTYVPGTLRTSTFRLKPFVELYGGFSGSETDLTQRTWQQYKSILSGDVLGNDSGGTNNTENVYHVVTGTNNVTIDGFIITGGNANGSSGGNGDGGGFLNYCNAVTIRNCSFLGNKASGFGAAMYFFGSQNVAVTATVENCTIKDNQCEGWGGGAAWNISSILLEDCRFEGNLSVEDGGGAHSLRSTIEVRECTFVSNTVTFGRSSGGLNLSYTTATVDRCAFVGNVSGSTGGGLSAEGNVARTTIRDSLFAENRAQARGAGVYNFDAPLSIQSCVFTRNALLTGSRSGGGLCTYFANTNRGSVRVSDCLFSDNSANLNYGGGIAVTSQITSPSEPTIIERCIFTGNLAAYGGGCYIQIETTAVVRSCIFLGNKSQASSNGGGGIYFNMAGKDVQNCSFFGNVSAYDGGAIYHTDVQACRVQNSVLWSNRATRGAEIYGSPASALAISDSDISGGWNGADVSAGVGNGGGNLNANPFAEPVSTGTWTQAASYDPATCLSTLQDAGASWTPGAWKGMYVQPTAGAPLLHYVVSNGANTLLIWGNYSATVQASMQYVIRHFRSQPGSVCVDAGADLPGVTNDLEGVARPLDGNVDGIARWDIGAYEHVSHLSDTDHDGAVDQDEVIAGTNPTNAANRFSIAATLCDVERADVELSWGSCLGRLYTIESTTNLTGGTWNALPGLSALPGTGAAMLFTNTLSGPFEFYRARVSAP